MYSSNLQFFLVDVFADKPLSGNPLALVTDADELSDTLMRQIAREFNQSETTFVLSSTNENVHWRLRSFTPDGSEVFGAGHNALGAWWWLAETGKLDLSEGKNSFTQEIGQHRLPVDIVFKEGDLSEVSMVQASPQFEQPLRHVEHAGQLACALGLGPEVLDFDGLFPQVVSTGAAHLLVPVRSRETISRIHPQQEPLAAMLGKVGAQGCYAFCLDTVESDSTAHARFFNPTVGISEDPATGSAAGPLACYLKQHGVIADGTSVRIEQGYEMGRPSRINIQVSNEQVHLSGQAITVAKGDLLL